MLQRAHCQGIVGGKGMRCESSAKYCRCVHPKFLCSSVKTGHWETEKAEHKNADFLVYMVRVTRPALMLLRK